MTLAPGTRLGPYEVVAALGAGGMGEVYRARDVNLAREVALKVLPPEFTADADRVARFEREARMLAALNHPRIAQIYGLEAANAQRVLVMELVAGVSLADRIRRGPLTVREALDLGRQVAEGLEAAHERGIIHRDLKPANIQITPDGQVKILDFGLAKALAGDEGGAPNADEATLTAGPSMPGMMLGTPAYMCPEQARGAALDRRTDIWAFGCVLYECLTGRRAFPGETTTDALAAVLERDPDWSALPPGVPPSVRVMLQRCLRKEVRERLRDIGDVRIELGEATTSGVTRTGGGATLEAGPSGSTAPMPTLLRHRWIAISHVAITVALGAALIWSLARKDAAPGQAAVVTRLSLNLPPQTHMGTSPADLTLSPDGSELVMAVRDERPIPGVVVDNYVLYRRLLSEISARLVPDSQGASSPRYSPDGRSVAFVDIRDQKLKRVSLAGGAPQEVLQRGEAALRAFDWLDNDTLIYSIDSALLRVPLDGGEPETLINRSQLSLSKDEFYLDAPSQMPGAGNLLFGALGFERSTSGIWVRAGSSAHRIEGIRGILPKYVGHGYLLFLKPVLRGGTQPSGQVGYSDLYAIRFDPGTGRVAGAPVVAIEGVRWGQFAVSSTGTLVYNASHEGGFSAQLIAVDSKGAAVPLAEKWSDLTFLGPRVSPDGTRMLMWGGPRPQDWRVRIVGLKNDSTRILAAVPSGWAAWTPDSQRIVFNHQGPDSKTNWNLYWKFADGSGPEERLTTSPYLQQPLFVTPDGWLVYQEEAVGTTGYDLMRLPLNGTHAPAPLRRTKANEYIASLAPGGAYMSFVSDETGRAEVWICRFPACESSTQVSTGGGTGPLWSRDGQVLYYRDVAATRLFAVPVSWAAGSPSFGTPTVTTGDWVVDSTYGRNYDVMPDGKHVAMIAVTYSGGRELTVVLNWFEELKAKLAAGAAAR